MDVEMNQIGGDLVKHRLGLAEETVEVMLDLFEARRLRRCGPSALARLVSVDGTAARRHLLLFVRHGIMVAKTAGG